MSSKITQPNRGMLAGTTVRPSTAAPKSRATKRQQQSLDGHPDEGQLFSGDIKEEASARPARGSGSLKEGGGPGAHPTLGLARPQAGRGGAAGLAQAVLGRGQKPEYSQWERLIAQASPERLRAGQAVLNQHAPALMAFAQTVSSSAKTQEP